MAKPISSSSILLPVPTGWYVSMRDLLGNSNMACGPALRVPEILREDFGVAATHLPEQNTGNKKPLPA